MAINSAEIEDRLESNPQGLVGETYVGPAYPIHDNQSSVHKGNFVVVIDSDTRMIKEVIDRGS
jgi:hypothetical protein